MRIDTHLTHITEQTPTLAVARQRSPRTGEQTIVLIAQNEADVHLIGALAQSDPTARMGGSCAVFTHIIAGHQVNPIWAELENLVEELSAHHPSAATEEGMQ